MVRQKTLLLLAGIVWLIAGGNVLKIGLETYQDHLSSGNILLSALVFLIFWFMIFGPMTKKHPL